MNATDLTAEIAQRWPGQTQCQIRKLSGLEVTCAPEVLPAVSGWLFLELGYGLAGLIVEEGAAEWLVRYVFYGQKAPDWVHLLATASLAQKNFPSISRFVHAADWHEREAEDLFGLTFEGHPRLGDFVLHNDAWQESVEPMRHAFNAREALLHRAPDPDWRPLRIVYEPGAFVMPIGPVYSGVTESVHFLLETVGEDVISFDPRLFYKWRAVEKLAEGRTIEDALLLAERFAATTAFAHGLAFCEAVEAIGGTEVPARAQNLRVFLSELERFRQHAGAIEAICESTALAVAASQAAMFEEDLLRVSGELTGHRYLFGLLAPGGLRCDLDAAACGKALEQSREVLKQLTALERQLCLTSSFLDRLEEVGAITQLNATVYGLAGPVARASGLVRDLRRTQPYSGYDTYEFEVPSEEEGDGYARLRVLFAEAAQSVRIMEQACARLESGSIFQAIEAQPGAALGWIEAPRGAAFHWVRLDENGRIRRWRVMPPSFPNWHGFHLAVENFAFQDFPIILATFDLSVAENDR